MQILSLIYFLFVCIHLNAAGLAGVLLGGLGLYAVFTNQPSLIALVLVAIIAFHGIVKGLITGKWKQERQRNYSYFHMGISAVLLVYCLKSMGYF